MRKLSLVLMILSGLSLLANSALAFRIMPASLALQLKRGETQTQILNVINSEATPVSCRVYVTGFEVLRDGKQLFEEATQEYSARDWIKPGDTQFELAPESTREVKVDIAVPRNAESGEYFATIMAESTIPAQAKTPQGLEVSFGVNFRLGCITIITVPGRTIRRIAEISEFQVEAPSAETEEHDIRVIATLENKSRVHLDVEGEVWIRNLEDRVFDRFFLQGTGKNVRGKAFVFPESRRDFWGEIQRPLPAGEYLAEASFSYGYQSRRIRAKTNFAVTEEMSESQKQLLMVVAEPNPLELRMSPGSFRTGSLKVWNLDFEPLKVDILNEAPWLETRPNRFTIRIGKYQTIRVLVSIPAEEPAERASKILLKPERGKPVSVDIVVSEHGRESEDGREAK